MIANKGDYKLISLKSKEAGQLNVEILPCNAQGKVLTEADGIIINNPQTDLLNKNVNFLLKINNLKDINDLYEDVYCQFQMFNDPTVYKTPVLKGNKGFDFNFSKQFTFTATSEFLDQVLNQCLYIQVWAEQKHTKPDPSLTNVSTKEYVDRQKEMNNNVIGGREILNNVVDPEKQKLKDELKISSFNAQRNGYVMRNLVKLSEASGAYKNSDAFHAMMNAKNDEQANQVLKLVRRAGPGSNDTQNFDMASVKVVHRSKACTIV